jgi:hypothetical protein
MLLHACPMTSFGQEGGEVDRKKSAAIVCEPFEGVLRMVVGWHSFVVVSDEASFQMKTPLSLLMTH